VGMFVILGCAYVQTRKPARYEISNNQLTRVSYVEENESEYINQALAEQVGAHKFVEIEFAQGSASLSSVAKMTINTISVDTPFASEISDVIVISWADQEYPSDNLKQLSKAQRELSLARNEAIKNYLKTIRSFEIDTYSMAEQPSALSKILNNSETRLKTSLLQAGLPTTADELQYPSKASKAIVLIKVD
jgi:hypothetical protein